MTTAAAASRVRSDRRSSDVETTPRALRRPVSRLARCLVIPLVGALLLGFAPSAGAVSNLGDSIEAWPASFSSYLMENGSAIADTNADQNPGEFDLGSGPAGTSQTVYYATNGTTAFFRIRMAGDLADATKGGLVGGAFLVQLYQGTTLRAVVGIDGKSPSADTVYVSNAPGATVTNVYTYPWTGTSAAVRTVNTGDGTGQHFLDFQVPLSRILAASGGTLTAATPVRLFYGSSAAANLATINKDFMIGDAATYLSYLPQLSEISLVPGALATSRTSAIVSGSNPPTEAATSTYDVTLTMSATSDGMLNGATTTATIPAGVSYLSSTAPVGDTVNVSGTTLTWNAGSIYGQTSTSIIVRLATTPANGSEGAVVTLLSAISSTAVDSSVPTNRTATAPDVTVGPVAAGANQPPIASDFSTTVPEDGGPSTFDAAAQSSDGDGDPLTYRVTSGVAHGTLVDNGNGTFTYTPAANYTGLDQLTYTACDAAGACDTGTVTITVSPMNDTPVATDTAVTATEDTTSNIDLGVLSTDVDGDVLTYSVIGPAHGTLGDNGTGSFTYTPDADYTGPDEFTYTVCDAAGACDDGIVTIMVGPINDSPVADDAAVTVLKDSESTIELTLLTSDIDGDLLTYAVSGAAHGTVIHETGGSVTYIPDSSYTGPDEFTYLACDESGACASGTITVTVGATNGTPVAIDTTITAVEDTPSNIDLGLLASDVDGDTLAYTVVGAEHGLLTDNGNGLFTYTPDLNHSGPDQFNYLACDLSGACATGTVKITVLPVNDAPVTTGLAVTLVEDTDSTIELGLLTSDIDGDLLTYTVSGAAHGTLVDDGNGTITYTPSADYSGPDEFTYTVCDTATPPACATATVTITVTPGNDIPSASNAATTTIEDTELSIPLSATDGDGDELNFAIVDQPAHGTLTLVGSTATYTPNAGYNGFDSFTYNASDPTSTSAPATVSISVTPVNDGPTADAKAASTGEKASVDVQLSGSDADGDQLTYAISGQPAFGTVSVNGATGNASYTPQPGHGGVDTFTYTVSDGLLTSTPATVTVTTVLGSEGTYFPVSPYRLLDTRAATGTPGRTRVGPGQTVAVQVAGVPGSSLPATGIAAVSINLTATESTGTGYLVAHASGSPLPPTSNVNYVKWLSVPNAATVPVGADGKILVHNPTSEVHVVVDVVGWYATAGQTTGSRLQALPPFRILDTRSGTPIGGGATLDVQVTGAPGSGVPATGVAAVVMNLTEAGNDRGGWMTVYPTDEARQFTSSINFVPGEIDPNMVVSKVSAAGQVSIYNLQGNAHVLVDILGYYTDPGGSGGRYVAIQPERLADTRTDVGGFNRTPIGPDQTIPVAVAGVPGSAVPAIGPDATTGIVANVTVASTTAGGFLTVHPTGETRHGTSTLNMVPNQVVPNLTVAKVGNAGRISVYNQQGLTNVIVDVVGYFRL